MMVEFRLGDSAASLRSWSSANTMTVVLATIAAYANHGRVGMEMVPRHHALLRRSLCRLEFRQAAGCMRVTSSSFSGVDLAPPIHNTIRASTRSVIIQPRLAMTPTLVLGGLSLGPHLGREQILDLFLERRKAVGRIVALERP